MALVDNDKLVEKINTLLNVMEKNRLIGPLHNRQNVVNQVKELINVPGLTNENLADPNFKKGLLLAITSVLTGDKKFDVKNFFKQLTGAHDAENTPELKKQIEALLNKLNEQLDPEKKLSNKEIDEFAKQLAKAIQPKEKVESVQERNVREAIENLHGSDTRTAGKAPSPQPSTFKGDAQGMRRDEVAETTSNLASQNNIGPNYTGQTESILDALMNDYESALPEQEEQAKNANWPPRPSPFNHH